MDTEDGTDTTVKFTHFSVNYAFPIWKLFLGLLSASSVLSLAGSLAIIYSIFTHRHYHYLYHRIMLGISLADIVSTVSQWLSPFAAPQGLFEGLEFARGNVHTCRINAFFLSFFQAPFFYNVGLTLYFLMVNRWAWRDKDISPWLEAIMHLAPTAISIGVGIAFLLMDAIHLDALFGVCDTGPYPPGCVLSPKDETEQSCERGRAFFLAWNIFNVIVGCTLVFSIGGTWLICATISKQQKRSLRHSYVGEGEAQRMQRKQDVKIQSILYTVCFGTPALLNIYSVFSYNSPKQPTARAITMCFGATIAPLQGLFNSFIYFRIRVRSWRNLAPQEPWLRAVHNAISKGGPSLQHILSSRRNAPEDNNRPNNNDCNAMEDDIPSRTPSCSIEETGLEPYSDNFVGQTGVIPPRSNRTI